MNTPPCPIRLRAVGMEEPGATQLLAVLGVQDRARDNPIQPERLASTSPGPANLARRPIERQAIGTEINSGQTH